MVCLRMFSKNGFYFASKGTPHEDISILGPDSNMLTVRSKRRSGPITAYFKTVSTENHNYSQ